MRNQGIAIKLLPATNSYFLCVPSAQGLVGIEGSSQGRHKGSPLGLDTEGLLSGSTQRASSWARQRASSQVRPSDMAQRASSWARHRHEQEQIIEKIYIVGCS